MQSRFAIHLGLVILMLLPVAPAVRGVSSSPEGYPFQQAEPTGSYVQHDPIVINGNYDFRSQDWPGSGTVDDPFIIESLNITDTAVCINITETTFHFEIRNCFISCQAVSPFHGLLLRDVENGRVQDCKISRHYNGICVASSSDCKFVNNTVYDNSHCGISIVSSSSCSMSNNSVFENACEGSWYPAGIRVKDCNKTEVFNNTSSRNLGKGYSFFGVYDCIVYGNIAKGNGLSGFYLDWGEECRLSNNLAFNNSVNDLEPIGGFHVCYSRFITLDNNTASDNKGNGFTVLSQSNCNLTRNTAREQSTGFLIAANDCSIRRNVAFKNTRGFDFGFTEHNQIANNTASNNTDEGFYLGRAWSCVVQSNLAVGNEYGLFAPENSKENTLRRNRLGYNEEANGFDAGSLNDWDNNSWSDYDGHTPYVIPGSANSTDEHPRLLDLVPPSIDHPSDVEFDVGTEGNNITWNPKDAHPESYEVYQNGTLVESGTWNGSNIIIDLDHLQAGIYNITLVVYDEGGNSVQDTAIVVVITHINEYVLGAIAIATSVIIISIILWEFKERST